MRYSFVPICLVFYDFEKSFFYRTSNGAEIDVVLTRGTKKIAIEFKASLAPTLTKGFWNALNDIKPDKAYIVIPEGDAYFKKENVQVISLSQFLMEVKLD